jgi:GNAT superfamily N-acetyltransferase
MNAGEAKMAEPTAVYPIVVIGRLDAADFVASLDEATRTARFLRHVTPSMVHVHYNSLDMDSTLIFAWIAAGAIRGLSEVFLYDRQARIEAELAVLVAPGWRSRGIGHRLLAHANAEAAHRGARQCSVLLTAHDCAQRTIIRKLGGMFDTNQHVGIIQH